LPGKVVQNHARECSLEIARANDVDRGYTARVGIALQHTIVETGCRC
jgi:hypothetical protein